MNSFYFLAIVRAGFLAVALAAWFWTQSLIGRRPAGSQTIGDRIHELTAPLNAALQRNPRWANTLLIVSSFFIDTMGGFIIVYSIVGPSVRPLVGLLLIFSLRQICQAITALPPPEGIIWRSPGFPSFLVTYGVSNDLFFSGHTAIAVLGALVLGMLGNPWLTGLAVTVALFEVIVVLILRAHYTLDVFTGVLVALWLWSASDPIAHWIDRSFQSLSRPSF